MPDTIRDGSGSGFLAKVGSDKRLNVRSVAESLQHAISNEEEGAYQIIGEATLANTTVVALHLKNDYTDKNVICTYIRHQIIDHAGGTAFPNASNYFSIAIGRTYSSGGSTATPVNVHAGSGNAATVTVYTSAPTLAGTANEIDRWYTKAEGDMNSFNKEGALILAPNNTIELRYIGDQTSGKIYSRLSFIVENVTT